MQTSKTGIAKFLVYARIGIHVLWRYRRHIDALFLRRAWILLNAFSHNKLIRVGDTYKLHLYLPAYPTKPFFGAVENKLLAHPPRPVTVVLSTTKACGFACPHCYQRFDARADVPLETLLQTVDALAAAGVRFLNVEGGDAFIDFPRLLAVVERAGDNMETWINTTGANVDADKLRALKAAGAYGLMVSLHGADAGTHDAFTGRAGSFAQALETLRLCHAARLASSVNTVLEYDMIQAGALPEIMRIARREHCGFVQLIHPKRAGSWLANTALDAHERALVRYVRKMHRAYNGFLRASYPALPAQAVEELPDHFGCTAGGIDRFYVGASGDVQPCEFLNLSFGNVTREPFADIFARMREHFPAPGTDWLCATQADRIADYMRRHAITQTPLPPEHTLALMRELRHGAPTALYRKMKLYEN